MHGNEMVMFAGRRAGRRSAWSRDYVGGNAVGDTGEPIDYTDLVGESPICASPTPAVIADCDTSSPTYGCYKTAIGTCTEEGAGWALPEEDDPDGIWEMCCPSGFGPAEIPAGYGEPDEPIVVTPPHGYTSGTTDAVAEAYEQGRQDERGKLITYTIVTSVLAGVIGWGLARILP